MQYHINSLTLNISFTLSNTNFIKTIEIFIVCD